MTTGRNFDEVLRVTDSLQLTANHKVATPAQQPGEDVIIAGSVSNEAAKERYPTGGRSHGPTSASSRRRAAGKGAAASPGYASSSMQAHRASKAGVVEQVGRRVGDAVVGQSRSLLPAVASRRSARRSRG